MGEDSSGNIYVTWVDGGYAYVAVYCVAASGNYCTGKTGLPAWETATDVDATYGGSDVLVDISVAPSGIACVGWGDSNKYAYWNCYDSGWLGDDSLGGADGTADIPGVVAIDYDGYLIDAFWYNNDLYFYVFEIVSGYTVVTDTTYSYTTMGSGNSYAPQAMSLACETQAEVCALLYSAGVSTSAWDLKAAYSTTYFTSQTDYTMESVAWSGGSDAPSVWVAPGGAALSRVTQAYGGVAYLTVSSQGGFGSASYTIQYAYTTTAFTSYTQGSQPSASSGLYNPEIAVEGAAASPFVCWYDGTNTWLAGSYTQSGSDFAKLEEATTSAPGIGITTANLASNVPWRADFVYYTGGSMDWSYLWGPTLTSLTDGSITTMDIGPVAQSVTLTANAYTSGSTTASGFGFSTYSWPTLPTGCSSTSGSFSCTPTAIFSGTITVTGTDAAGFTSNSVSLSLTVNSALTGPSSITPNTLANFDVNQAFSVQTTLTSTGTSTYSWRWYDYVNGVGPNAMTICAVNTGVGASGGTVETCSVAANSFTAGDAYEFFLQQGDSSSDGAEYANSPISASQTVNAALAAGVPTPATASVDVGQTLTLSNSESGGTPALSYQWYDPSNSGTCSASSPSVGGATSASYSPTFGSAGTSYYCYRVTDSSGEGAEVVYSSTTTITVYADPTAGAVTPSPVVLDTGQTITLTAHPASGTGTYGYQWYSVGSAGTCSTSDTVLGGQTASTYVASAAAGSLYYCYIVTDAGTTAGASPTETADSATVQITVYADPTAGAVTAATTSIDLHQSDVLTAHPGSGTGTYTDQWYSAASSGTCSASDTSLTAGATYSASPASAATYYYCYIVTDSGTTAGASPTETADSATITLVVYADPVVSSIAGSPASGGIDVGQSTTWTPTLTGGTGTITTYTWAASSGNFGCSIANTATISCTPTAAGSYTVSLIVVDSNGCYSGVATTCASPGAAVSSASFTVDSDPTVSSLTASPASGDGEAGQSYTFAASGTGGSGSYNSWSWTGLPSGCGASGSSVTCTPVYGGVYSLQVSAQDTNGWPFSSTLSVIIQPAGSYLPHTSQILGPAGPADVGATVSFNTTASGGTGNYTQFTWTESGVGMGCATVNADLITCTPTAPGSYSLTVTVTDSDGRSSHPQTYSGFSVNSPLLAGVVTPSALAIDNGQSIRLSSSAPSGGTAPYSYQWLSGSSPACSGDQPLPSQSSGTLWTSPMASAYYCLSFSDNGSGVPAAQVYSNVVFVLVNPSLAVPAISPSSPAIDAGQRITLTASESGGTAPYQFTWYTSSTSVGSCSAGQLLGETSTWTVTPAFSADYCFVVSDSSMGAPAAGVSSPWTEIAVSPALRAGAIYPSSRSIDQGQSLQLISARTGGTPGYAYEWFSSLSGTGSCSSGDLVPAATGPTLVVSPTQSTYFCYQVTDSSTVGPISHSSGWALVIVHAPLGVGAPSASALAIDTTQSVVLVGSASGGTPSLSFQWFEQPGGGACSSSSTPVPGATSYAYYTPSTLPAGIYSLCYSVTDRSAAGGETAFSSSVRLVISPDPTLSPIEMVGPTSCSAFCSASASQTLSVSSTASLGGGAYQFYWTVDAGLAGCSGSAIGAVTSVYSCVVGPVASSQVWSVSLSVVDGRGCGAPGSCLSLNPLTFSVTLLPATTLSSIVETSPVSCTSGCSADSGQDLTVETTASGGSGTYTFSWTVTSGVSTCSGSATGAATSAYSCSVGSLAVAQSWTVSVTATGVAGGPETFTVTLEPDPVAVVDSAPSSGSIVAGQEVTFSALPSDGSGVYSGWGWSYLPAGCSNLAQSAVTCIPSVGGSFSVSVRFNDSNGYGPVLASMTALIQPAASALKATLSSQSTSASVGGEITLSVVLSGGGGPSTLQWYENGAEIAGATGTEYEFTPSSTGFYSFTVVVSTSGEPPVASNSLTIQVSPPMNSSSGTMFNIDDAGAVLLPLALGLSVAILVLGRGSQRKS